ncbi:MAG: ABC-F family ATP-binding cassette domain-containing protein [Rhodothermia bacterium]|nr:MAG: ABC-F family ATP-binding cassette domain-containing protein [Rhodothermia bacterium]
MPVLRNVSWTLSGTKRIGLVGPNGAGKTTLLRLISGEAEPDEGSVSLAGDSIGYFRQETQEQASERSVLEEALLAFSDVHSLQTEEERLLREIESFQNHDDSKYEKLLSDMHHVHERLVQHESHMVKPRTEAILSGLGFSDDELDRPISSFSGGWRMRAALAKLLLSDPDVLLLDEPTNHLDIDSIDWLEGYLKSFRGSVVIVSHDRYFLDRMVTSIAELGRGKLTEYAGNYRFYLAEREERRTNQRATWENQQKMISETERFIERFRAKASKARQVQSRVKMLENLDRLPPPLSDEASIAFRFPEPPRSNRSVFELSMFSKTYDGEGGYVKVFSEAGPLHVERGDRIALIGQNGAGKSTLARIMLGTEPFSGERTLGTKVTLSFFAQNQAETLPADRNVYEVLRESAVDQTETRIRSLLGAFLFHGDDVFKPVSVLSGGERSRVALAKTLVSPANFLVLDEPTNHLDILSRQVLVEALQQYTGTYVVVSHDRHFLDQIARKVWRVENGGVREFHGNYSDSLWQMEHGTASQLRNRSSNRRSNRVVVESTPRAKRTGGPKTKEQKRQEAEERKRRKERSELEGLADLSTFTEFQLNRIHQESEGKINQKETEKAELEKKLADPDFFEDPERVRKVSKRLSHVQEELERLVEEWSSVAQELENR